ncbi:MAG: T9SS type A sorting domain-containing protein [Flavobacteriales bacterium]|nr:T9SS type A sorting domain-containing protein [Flavobacteriales bacterium]
MGTIHLDPNPAVRKTSFVQLKNFTENSQTIQLINASGSMAKEIIVNSKGTSLNLLALSREIYIVHVSDEKNSVSKRLIKQ